MEDEWLKTAVALSHGAVLIGKYTYVCVHAHTQTSMCTRRREMRAELEETVHTLGIKKDSLSYFPPDCFLSYRNLLTHLYQFSVTIKRHGQLIKKGKFQCKTTGPVARLNITAGGHEDENCVLSGEKV